MNIDKNNKRRIITPLAIALLGLSSTSCEKVRDENAEEAERAYTIGASKTLSVILKAEDQANYVREKRFYDSDGDGKTVEQYIELYGLPSGDGTVMPTQVIVNLIRPGVQPKFDGCGAYSFHKIGKDFTPREMTREEEQEIDEEYKIMLRKRGE